MGTAHKTPTPKRRRNAARGKVRGTPDEKPPLQLKTALAKRLWELRCKARREGMKPLSAAQVEDLIDDMRG